MIHRLILLTSFQGNELDRLIAVFSPYVAELAVARDRSALDPLVTDGVPSRLIAFGTSVILPEPLLRDLNSPSYNIHAASPRYPGRDAHHFAVFDGATTYGATLHLMTASVDAGPIVDVEEFQVCQTWTPYDLLMRANEAGFLLAERHAVALASTETLPCSERQVWGGNKRTRKDFLAACDLSPNITREEFERRFSAFDGGAYDNLTLKLHGWTFRIDKSIKRLDKD